MINLKRYWERAAMELEDERGAALVLVMVMLVMLTFIGLAALSTSSTELLLSANFRRSREAFQTAEGLTETAVLDNSNFVVPVTASGSCSPGRPLSSTTTPNGGYLTDTDSYNSQQERGSGCVVFTTSGPVPAGRGFSNKMNSSTKANYFIVYTTGSGGYGAHNTQELMLSKVVP